MQIPYQKDWFYRVYYWIKTNQHEFKKFETIINWKDLKSVTGLKLFLGFYNYYRRFIAKWSNKTEPFIKMIKKDKFRNWDDKKLKINL